MKNTESMVISLAAVVIIFCMGSPAWAMGLSKRVYTGPWGVEFEGDVGFSFHKRDYHDYTINNDGSMTGFRAGDMNIYQFRLTPGIGLFVHKGLQVILKPVFTYRQVDYKAIDPDYSLPGAKEYGGGMDFIVRYVISTKSAVFPFIGFGFGGVGGTLDDFFGKREFNSFEAGPQVGIKFLFAKRGILTFSFNYWFESYEIEGVEGREDRHSISFGIALGFWL